MRGGGDDGGEGEGHRRGDVLGGRVDGKKNGGVAEVVVS